MAEFLLAPINAMINHYLSLDPQSSALLKPLDKHCISFTVSPVNKTAFCYFEEGKINLSFKYDGQPQLKLSGSALAFMQNGLKKSAGFSNDIKVQGDTQLAQQFKHAIDCIYVDWEEVFAGYVGDSIAHGVGHFFRKGKQFFEDTCHNFQQNFTEYMQEEARQFPTRTEVNDFIDDVNQLRDDVARLEVRISRL